VQFAAENVIPATLIAGDGIGPEIVEATVMVLDALRAPFEWEVHKAGMAGLEAFGDPLPQTTLDSRASSTTFAKSCRRTVLAAWTMACIKSGLRATIERGLNLGFAHNLGGGL
jgi:isocitrate/isopropylmalate dehydrogenase